MARQNKAEDKAWPPSRWLESLEWQHYLHGISLCELQTVLVFRDSFVFAISLFVTVQSELCDRANRLRMRCLTARGFQLATPFVLNTAKRPTGS